MYRILERRQDFGDFNDPNDTYFDDNYWSYSKTAVIVKWSVVAAIFVIFITWFVGGYFHAQRRMRKGLAPLLYHKPKWLLPRSQRLRFQSGHQNDFSFYRTQNSYNDGYGLQAFPPPAYNSDHVPPPTYQPPEGASKINPDQDYAIPPPGHPPGVLFSFDAENQMPGRPAQPPRARWMRKINPFK
ncbi:hypothetical protein MMC06_002984 [Schaereria dolodes]|nr:hypothetical protein [Schaereria dolodes]